MGNPKKPEQGETSNQSQLSAVPGRQRKVRFRGGPSIPNSDWPEEILVIHPFFQGQLLPLLGLVFLPENLVCQPWGGGLKNMAGQKCELRSVCGLGSSNCCLLSG